MAAASNYQAWVEVVPQFKGFNKSVDKNVSQSLGDAGDAGGKAFGSRLASVLGTIAKPIAIAGGVAFAGIGAAAGVALTKGLDRSLSIQDATAKLTGLGHSGESVQTIMDSALASVKGTAFGLGDAAGVAAGAVAAGIEPGEKLTRVLSLMADSATIAGTDLGSMGSIFNKVAASGKLQGDVIAQLQDAGVPVLQFVAKQMGVTAEEAANLASQGKVSFATFADAMEAGLGGAALSSGKTARGAFANLGAALGRFGAKFTEPVVAAAPAFFASLTGAIDKLSDKAQPFADQFSRWVGPAIENAGSSISAFINGEPGKLADFFGGIGKAVETIAPYLPQLAKGIGDFGGNVGSILGPAITDNLPGLQTLADTFLSTATEALPQLLPALGALVLALLPIVPAITPLITEALPPLIDLFGQLVDVVYSDATGLDTRIAAFKGLGDALAFLVSAIPGPLVLLPQLSDAFKSTEGAVNLVNQIMTGKFGPVLQFIGGAVFDLANTIRSAILTIVGVVQSGVENVRATVARVFGELPAPVRAALGLIGSIVSAGISGAVSTIATLAPRAIAAVGGLGGALVGAGRSLVDGFVQGITGGIQRAASAAANVARAAVDAAKAALDINSPSRVFRDDIGVMVGRGFVEGLDRSAGIVQAAIERMIAVPTFAPPTIQMDQLGAAGAVIEKPTVPDFADEGMGSGGKFRDINFNVTEMTDTSALANAVTRRINAFVV
jgi:tape measure domain-containing protein